MSKKNCLQIMILIALCALIFQSASAQTGGITYQGSLKDGGNPANGQYDFEFKLYDTDTVGTGTQHGGAVLQSGVTVTGGTFTVLLGFPSCATCFDGSARFLEISVKPVGSGTFTTLSPRQFISSTPYALRSSRAGLADGLSVACVNCVTSSQIQSVQGSQVTGNIAGSQINGTIPVASVPSGSASYIQNTSTQQASSNFNVSGNGTVGGTLKGNIVTATTQYNLGDGRILGAPGSLNLFAGLSAGSSNTTGAGNSFFGTGAGLNNAEGSGNSFFGLNAGTFNTTGIQNAFFGGIAGSSNTTGNGNTIIGNSANVGLANLNFATAIGARAVVTRSNSIVLGAIQGTNFCTAASQCDSVNVGIGTTAPVSALHLNGNSTNFALTFTNQQNTAGRRGYRIAFDNDRLTFQSADDNGNFSGNQVAIEQFSGRVGIGTINTCCSTPFQLQVAGSVGPNTDGSSNLGSAALRWAAVYAVNGTIQTSDARLKRAIKPLGYGVSELMRLRPVSFRWKDNSDARLHLGLLAQDVEQVVPEVVVRNDDETTPLGMNYAELVPVLIKAGQEQQAQIEQQRAQIKEQQREIESLKQRVQEIYSLKALTCTDHPAAEVCKSNKRTGND
jgi:endosialidase-like protein